MVVAMVRDLIFATKIRSTGAALGVEVRSARGAADAAGASLVLIDIDDDEIDLEGTIRALLAAEPRPRIVAFGSHVNAERIRAARAAGADEVLPRSALVAKLPGLIGFEA